MWHTVQMIGLTSASPSTLPLSTDLTEFITTQPSPKDVVAKQMQDVKSPFYKSRSSK
jgi:hypothetical protein